MRYKKSHLLSLLLCIHMKILSLRIYFALRSIATHSHFQMSLCRYDCSNFIRSTGDKETSMKRARDETTKKLEGEELDYAIYRVVRYGNVSGLRELLETYDNITEREFDNGRKALHFAVWYGQVDVAKLLIQCGANVNAVNNDNESVLCYVSYFYLSVPLTLELICLGANIDKYALKNDMTGLLVPIKERLEKLRNGERCITNLCSNEENKYKWNLAFCLTLKYKVAAFKAYYSIRSFITYHGIFMASGYDLGDESIWKKEVEGVCYVGDESESDGGDESESDGE
jgi:hypothetical protein